jgi:ABC-type multidrug transport system permease subunit
MGDSLRQLTLVRFREFFREPDAVFWTFAFPILLATGLGIAFRHRPPEQLHVAVVGGAVPAGLAHDDRLTARAMPDSAAEEALRNGELALIAVVRDSGGIQYRYDEARPESRTARLIVDDDLQRGAGRADPVPVSERLVSEPGSRYIDFVVPGLLAMNLMGSGIWGLGFAIVDARRRKLLKRLVATPMSKAEYLLSFLLSRLGLLVLEVLVLLGFAVLVFGVPVRGSRLELGTICLVSALAFGGLGLLIASRAKTIEAVNGLMNLAMLPMWIFSGVFFSASNFPRAFQPFIQALPLTAVVNALRANMLQGAGWHAIVPDMAIIVAWAIGTFVIALRLFRWR